MRSEGIILLALTIMTLSSGCGLFQTRTPESPVSIGGVNPPASSADMVLSNFTSAVQQKNTQDYEKLFADSLTGTRNYYFIPSTDAAVRYQSVFARWTKASESQYFQNMIASLQQTDFPSLMFINPTFVRYQSDSAVISTEYLLIVPHRLTTVTTTFTGRTEFYVAPDKNQSWSIYRWVDISTKPDSSWSNCKGAFAQ